jgi:hypothetical protein
MSYSIPTNKIEKFVTNEIAIKDTENKYSCELFIQKLKYFMTNPKIGTYPIKDISPTSLFASDPNNYSLNCDNFREMRTQLQMCPNIGVSVNQFNVDTVKGYISRWNGEPILQIVLYKDNENTQKNK